MHQDCPVSRRPFSSALGFLKRELLCEQADFISQGQLLQPGRGYAGLTIKGTGELTRNGGRGVSVIAQIGGQQHAVPETVSLPWLREGGLCVVRTESAEVGDLVIPSICRAVHGANGGESALISDDLRSVIRPALPREHFFVSSN